MVWAVFVGEKEDKADVIGDFPRVLYKKGIDTRHKGVVILLQYGDVCHCCRGRVV